jgi:uncharacterized protein (TIGR02996 family)
MFALDIRSPDGTTRRFVTTARVLVIGSGAMCDVTLPGMSARHVRVVLDQYGYMIEDLSRAGIEVEHRTVTRWRTARVPETIELAGYTIACIDLEPPLFEASYGAIAPAEAALVDGIVTGDSVSRLVYADWLEERGDMDRAVIVRELVGGGRPDVEMLERLIPTNVRWRARVLEPPIEACPRRAACVGHWGKLEVSGRADLRRCRACAKLVLYCVAATQAREHVAAGGTVVFDPFVVRWPHDLGPR